MISAIILAAGKGTRLNSRKVNKVTLPFLGKPMIAYAVETLMPVASEIIVVVGAFSESVKQALGKYSVVFAHQHKRLGTGHAAKVGLKAIKSNPSCVLIGYGDHMMFYSKQTVEELIQLHNDKKATVTLVSTLHKDPNSLAWGRIIRNQQGDVQDIIEQKDATESQRNIQEINAGFYCFDYKFLKKYFPKLKKSSVTKEYYLTDMIKMAVALGKKVTALQVPFASVGIGVNRYEELTTSQQYYSNR